MTPTRRHAGERFASLVTTLGARYTLAAQVEGYRVTDIEPGDVEYVSTDWDGSEAEASYPNPTDDDTDLDFLADHYLFVPETLDEDDPPAKSGFKGPIRMGPGGPVNTNALLANVQAINGARGGFSGLSMDTLRSGFDAAVSHLVSAGVYDDADDAPDFEGEAALQASAHYGVGDTVTWGDGDADVYGIIRDKATSGTDVFADMIDGDFSLSPTEDNPGYLVETMDDVEGGWVPSGTMTGHRGETLEAWDPDKEILDEDSDAAQTEIQTAEAAGHVQADISVDVTRLTADTDGSTLAGIIWGAGDHDLALGGEPTPVRVPEDTIRPTFEALKEDIAAGDVTLGFDHPGPDSVAAKTGIVDIGVAQEAALTADGDYIVLTDSELTNDQAIQAAESGDFDDLDWSIVADVAVRRESDGSVAREDGRVVIDATRIRRVDAVDTGAVDASSIERDTAALPDLAEKTAMVQEAAQNPNQPIDDAVRALWASATAFDSTMDQPNFDPDNVDDLEDARDQLNAAASIIDDQEDDLEAAQAKASGFKRLLHAHGVDLDDYDGVEAAAQAVIDEQTEDTRREIAELEAELAQFDTDDTTARAEDLAGEDPGDLRNLLNKRKATAFDAQQKRQQKGRAAAKGDDAGRGDPTGGIGGGSGSGDADEIALSAMDGSDRIEAEARGQSPAEYVKETYGLHASQHDNGGDLHDAIMETINGGDA